MAEGWLRHLRGDKYEVFSAGIEKHGVNPYAIAVMKEVGVDLSSHSSKLLDEFNLQDLDCIVTVCGHAQESCPVVPSGCRVVHQGFDDPPKLAEKVHSEKEKLNCYRRVRDQIKAFVERFPGCIDS